jgi:hypothetical protein
MKWNGMPSGCVRVLAARAGVGDLATRNPVALVVQSEIEIKIKIRKEKEKN